MVQLQNTKEIYATIKRDVFLEKVRENKTKYQGAQELLIKAVEKENLGRFAKFQELVESYENASIPKTSVVFSPRSHPQDYSTEYDRVIVRAELMMEDQISLTEQEFNNYIMNEWKWVGSLKASLTEYAGSMGVDGVAGSAGLDGETFLSAANSL